MSSTRRRYRYATNQMSNSQPQHRVASPLRQRSRCRHTVSYSLDDSRFAIDANGSSPVGTAHSISRPSLDHADVTRPRPSKRRDSNLTIGVLNTRAGRLQHTADTDTATNQIAEGAAAAPRRITASPAIPMPAIRDYSLDDSRFTIDANAHHPLGTGTLDFRPSIITLTVTATSSDQSTATQTFTLVFSTARSRCLQHAADADTTTNQIAQNAVAAPRSHHASASDRTRIRHLQPQRFTLRHRPNGSSPVRHRTLNAQSQPSINLIVTATSSTRHCFQTFNLNVTSARTARRHQHLVHTSSPRNVARDPDPSDHLYFASRTYSFPT